MGLISSALFVILGLVVGNLAYELFTDQDWAWSIGVTFMQGIAILVFSWLIKDRIKKSLSEKEVKRLFDKFDQSGIKAGVCQSCGKELIVEMPADTPIETVVEVITNLAKIADLTFSHREGDLLHFRLS